MWDLPRPEIELMSPALQGVFLTTGPPGKALYSLLYICRMVFAEQEALTDGMWLTAGKVKTTHQPFVSESIRWVQDCDLLEAKNTGVFNHNKRIHSLFYWSRERNETVQLKGHVVNRKCESESPSVLFDSLRPHGLYSPRNSLGQNTGVASLSLLQGIFPTQGSNPCPLHCRQILYQLSHKVNWRIDE